jgi:hypothetical protein
VRIRGRLLLALAVLASAAALGLAPLAYGGCVGQALGIGSAPDVPPC